MTPDQLYALAAITAAATAAATLVALLAVAGGLLLLDRVLTRRHQTRSGPVTGLADAAGVTRRQGDR